MGTFSREIGSFPSPVNLFSDRWIQGAFSHQGVTRSLFSRAKFHGDQQALKILLDQGIARIGLPRERMLLLPVPPHKKRLLKRGYSIADRMAFLWGRSWGLPHSFTGVERKDDPQSKNLVRSARISLSIDDRWSFSANLRKGPVILVDDLATTGWTLKSLAHGLEERGVFVAGAIVLCLRERFYGEMEKDERHEI